MWSDQSERGQQRRSASISTSDVQNDPPSIFSGRARPTTSRTNSHGSVNRPKQPLTGEYAATPASTERSTSSPLSPDVTDRVFPIRSFVSVNPTPSQTQRQSPSDSYFPHPSRANSEQRGSVSSRSPPSGPSRSLNAALSGTEWAGYDRQDGDSSVPVSPLEFSGRRPSTGTTGEAQGGLGEAGYQVFSDEGSLRSESVPSTPGRPRPLSMGGRSSVKEVEDPGPLVTARFKHVVTEEGHAVITGRDGETLQRCEDEPIHIPGAVQSFGMLIVLQEESEGKLVVRIVSENSRRIIGFTPKQLFALESFTDILSDEQADNLLDHVDFVKDDATDVQANGPEIFTLSIRNAQRRMQRLWCAMHMNEKNPGLVICELELEDDHDNPLVPSYDRDTPEPPEDTLSSAPTEEEFRESTETQSRPLRVLRSARKRRGEAAAMEVFNIMSQVQEQLAEAPNLDQFLKVLCGVVKELTGFHRVMIYQFDQSFNGKVVTELVDPRATKDLYKGLHFPASDIPKQARDLYKINRVRLLYDRDHETSRLVCRTVEDLENPLDLTHSFLRAMSPIHIKYLANMAVRSSMSISINAFNELWGLISCHTYGSKGTRVSFPIRKMCRLVGDSASRNIERLSYASRLQARKLINTSPSSKNPSGYIIASSEDLLNLFDADFGLLSIHDETKILGTLKATQEALAMLEYCRVRKFTSVVTSQDVRIDFPDLVYPPGFQVIAGLLLVPLSAGGNDFIMFFRRGQLKEVKWAGNPYEKFIREGTEGYLEPRKSFKTWSETVVGKCREWTEEEVETAAVLCVVYGKFIEVWRQKEAALQNTQLTKLLLANSAHEVRTPLNAIINYLEIALEGSLDQETRDNLAKSHSASKSLIYVINDLLDLTKTEENAELIHEEVFDLITTFREATEPFQGDAKRKLISYDVIESPEVPQQVIGDQRRVRQAISNVVANAIQATTTGGVKVEMQLVGRTTVHADVEIVIEDTGSGMNSERLDALFTELEQAQVESNANVEQTITSGVVTARKDEKRTLGLGLALVARIIRNMDGQLRLKSEEGKGSRFVMLFPFDLPESKGDSKLIENVITKLEESGEQSPDHSAANTITDPTHLGPEVTLIDKATPGKGSSNRASMRRGSSVESPAKLSRQNSGGSLGSFQSGSSIHSGRSEVDRLIEAMQESPLTDAKDRPSSSKGTRKELARGVGSRSGPQSPSSERPPTRTWNEPKVPEHLRSMQSSTPGQFEVEDGRPLRAIKYPDELAISSTVPVPAGSVQFEDTNSPISQPAESTTDENFRVLIAEDDPINSRIMRKRLEKSGHHPFLTVNGEECASSYSEKPGSFDVILMDMQMPIVDGMTSTKMIRSFEKTHSSLEFSTRAAMNGRIPIFAVSASLVEKERQSYIDAGFDGWILKPISFPRLNELMRGIIDADVKGKCLYVPGRWEDGGWFQTTPVSAAEASTEPSGRIPASGPSTSLVEQAATEASESATEITSSIPEGNSGE